jgi:hypothetical protein
MSTRVLLPRRVVCEVVIERQARKHKVFAVRNVRMAAVLVYGSLVAVPAKRVAPAQNHKAPDRCDDRLIVAERGAR